MSILQVNDLKNEQEMVVIDELSLSMILGGGGPEITIDPDGTIHIKYP